MQPLFQARSLAVYYLLIILISNQNGLLKLCRAQFIGFLSIDCGSKSSQAYKDSLGIEWTPDSSLMQEGSTANVQAPFGSNDTRYGSIRYFEGNQTKYCYVLSVSWLVEGNFYLVRAAFWLGRNSDVYQTQSSDNVLDFKLIIDAYEAAEVSIKLPQSDPVVKEIYLQAQSNSIAVCLSGSVSGSDAPFISSLELRHLNDNMQSVDQIKTSQRALLTSLRINYGTPEYYPDVRYPSDQFDRIWRSDWERPSMSTNKSIGNQINDLPPVSVLQTAYVSMSTTTGFQSNFTTGIIEYHQYYCALYFSEIDPSVNASGLRVFDIFVDELLEYRKLDVYNETNIYGCFIVYGTFTPTSNYTIFKYVPTSTSMYPPFISAVEILQVLDSPMPSGTFHGDIVAVDGIKATLVNLSSYTGDPCFPQNYGYPWLNCTSFIPPRVTEILLSDYGLVGQIPTSINDLTYLTEIKLNDNILNGPIPNLSALTSLKVLDLSNNKLSGPIPESFSTLSSLKYLYLQNNNLSGPIPPILLTLQINYSGNPFLCNATCVVVPVTPPSASEGQVNIGLIVGLVVGGVLISILPAWGIAYIFCLRKQRPRHEETTSNLGGQNGPHAHNAPLSWRTRLQIMVDVATGLDYLHHGCNPQIIHRDVKSSNILLSKDMEAKIADFGISRLRKIDTSGATTLMGSWGYLDPEYSSTLNLTEKVDVYSFGVLLFEILCGRLPINRRNPKQEVHIVEWVRPYIEQGKIDEIVDKSMEDGYNISAVWKVVDIALRCIKLESIDRPDMSEICTELKDAMKFEIMGDQVARFEEPLPQYYPSTPNMYTITNVQAR